MSTSSNRPHGVALVIAAAAGAAAMYMLDPQQGRRRRALGRDQVRHLRRRAQDDLGVALRDLRHRLRGWAAQARGALQRGPVDDDILRERLRAAIGRATPHARAISVGVSSGRVTLSGPASTIGESRILAAVHAVPGVRTVDSRLERPARDDNPQARGEHRSAEPMGTDARRAHWPPGTRLLALAAGMSLAAWGMAARRRGALGGALLSAGAALATRAIANNSRASAYRSAAREADDARDRPSRRGEPPRDEQQPTRQRAAAQP